MNNSDADGQEVARRSKVRIPIAMMFVAIGMMFVALFDLSSGRHGWTVFGIVGNSGLGHWVLIGVGIGFEIVGLVIAVSAAVAARQIERH
jgi:hypothetical protein